MVTTDSTGVVDDPSPSNPNEGTVVTNPVTDDFVNDNVTTAEHQVTTQAVAVEGNAGSHQIANEPNAQTKVDNTANANDDDDDKNKGLLPLYVALLVCIILLVLVMVVMIVIVLILRQKAIKARSNGTTMSEEDKLSLMKEGYVNPTYQFFDKSSTKH